MQSVTIARWTLIAGLSFVFLYFGIDKFVHPKVWIGWMPSWIDGLFGLKMNLWFQIIAVTEIVIGAALLFPVRLIQQIASILAIFHLIAILTQVGWNDIAVRDGGILAMATALFYLL